MRIPSTFLLSSAFIALSAPQAAAEVCVSCTGPTATYLCSVKNADTIESLAGDKALRKICTKVLKRSERHSSCQVLDVPAGKCPGVAKTVGWGDVKKAAASGNETETKPGASPPVTAGAPAAVGQAKPADSGNAPSDAARPSAVATGPTAPGGSGASAPQAAPPPAEEPGLGEKLKGAAENTWKCVSSFFGNC